MPFILHAPPWWEKARGNRQISFKPDTNLFISASQKLGRLAVDQREGAHGSAAQVLSIPGLDEKALKLRPRHSNCGTERRGEVWQCPEGAARGGAAGFKRLLTHRASPERTRQQRPLHTGQSLRDMLTAVRGAEVRNGLAPEAKLVWKTLDESNPVSLLRILGPVPPYHAA